MISSSLMKSPKNAMLAGGLAYAGLTVWMATRYYQASAFPKIFSVNNEHLRDDKKVNV